MPGNSVISSLHDFLLPSGRCNLTESEFLLVVLGWPRSFCNALTHGRSTACMRFINMYYAWTCVYTPPWYGDNVDRGAHSAVAHMLHAATSRVGEWAIPLECHHISTYAESRPGDPHISHFSLARVHKTVRRGLAERPPWPGLDFNCPGQFKRGYK